MAKRTNRPQPQLARTQNTASVARETPERPLIDLGPSKRWFIPALILLALSFGLYFKSLSFGYILDDLMVIQENKYTQKGFGGLKQIFAEDSFNGYFGTQQKLLEGGRYRPLSLATFAAEIALFGPNKPNIGHFFNIVCYFLTALMLYLTLERIWPRKENQQWWWTIPFWASVLFVLHPLHSEAVANIKGRDEILALFFSLAALWAALRYADGYSPMLYQLLSGFLLFLGLLTKENTITFVAIIPMTLWYFKGFSAGKAASTSWPLYIAAIVFLIIRSKVLGYFMDPGVKIDDIMNNPFYGMTGSERLATTTMTLGWYVKLLIWPNPLTHDYYPFHVQKVGWSDWRAFSSLALYALMIGVAIWQMRKRSVLSYAIFFFIATTSVISNLVFSVGSFMNERFMFMPSVAIALVVAWLAVEKIPAWLRTESGGFHVASAGILGVLGLMFSYFTLVRVPEWKDKFTLNKTAIERSPGSARAQCFYGIALYEDIYAKEKDAEKKRTLRKEMNQYFDKALEIYPNYGSAMIMKSAMVGEDFLDNGDANAFLTGFEAILRKKSDIPYIDQMMDYVVGRIPQEQYTGFCLKMGSDVFLKQKRDRKNAVKYLEFGLKANPNDARLQAALAEAKGSAPAFQRPN
jgi:protein O-mannosyl-transferase